MNCSYLYFSFLQAHVYGPELVHHAEGFMDGVVSVAKSYFNASSTVSKCSAQLEHKNAEPWRKAIKLESKQLRDVLVLAGAGERIQILESELKGRGALEASPRSRLDVFEL